MSLPMDVRDLVERPGASRQVRLAETVADLSTPVAQVPSSTPVRGDLLFERVVEGILVSGPLSAEAEYRCARCLKEFRAPIEVRVTELFVPGAGEEDDEYPLPGDGTIDLEPMVRDAVVLELPFSPLCRPDCLGLCERCGGDRNLGECSCPPPTDPRWDGLTQLDL